MSELLHIGGKASSLVKLRDAGYHVPPFVVFTEEQCLKISNELIESKIGHLTSKYFAVRSSANLEDGKNHSFAGVFETELFIEKKGILQAIKKVSESKKTSTVSEYLKLNKLHPDSLKLAIVVQEMIDAESSGVAFGIDPSKPYKKSKIVSSVFGLGEGLVSGTLNADNYVLNKNKVWDIEIASKQRQLKHGYGKLDYVALTAEMQNAQVLNEQQLNKIAAVLDELEQLYGSPQDIEFCFKNNIFFLLQSRPITTIKKYKTHTIWDNSNIIESYPGITLPFTFSFILDVYESVYKNFGDILGVPREQVDANAEVFAEMLGHIKGRVYYHLINWYKALAMLPAYSINAGFMEKMMGVSEPLGVEFTLKKQPSKVKSYWNVVKTIFSIIKLNRKLPAIKKAFTKKVNVIIKDYKAKDYSDKTNTDIWVDYTEFKSLLINEWSPPLANDLLAMVYFGTLQKLCTNWLRSEHLHTKLVVGRYPVKSVLPAKMVEDIIAVARKEDKLSFIQSNSEQEVWTECTKNRLGETGKLILEYISLYGDRSVGELKLENETFSQNPLRFITILKSYDDSSGHTFKQQDIDLNKIAKEIPFHKRGIFKYVAKKAAEMVADRENLRFDRTFGFGTIRMFLWQMGLNWQQNGILQNHKDIFYLKESEVESLVKNNISAEQAKELVKHRKAEFKSYEDIKVLPERVHQWDTDLDLEVTVEVHDGQLKGIPCCSGEVTGKVRVLSDPSEVGSLKGDILVTTSTDPGWITIFKSASAILVERGSTLSHAAIVSREMGIPCIVAVKGITSILKDGDLVKMNGETGIIEQIHE